MTAFWIVLAAVVLGGGWYIDVRLRPMKPCPSCRGGKRWARGRSVYGYCRRCGKTGEVRRWGAPRKEKR